jgi:hypothetical protein
MTQQLLSTSKTDFNKCFEQWKNCWNKFIKSPEDDFEGI